MSRRDFDPYRTFSFQVEIENIGTAAFSEVSGLSAETEVIEYREGSSAERLVRKLPGLTKVNSITLKRGITGNDALWEWYQQVISGRFPRASGLIRLLDEEFNPAVTYRLRECWPSAYSGPVLSSTANEVAIEELVLQSEGLDVQFP